MSLGPVMVDIEGLELAPEDKELLAHPLVGGVILFSRNYQSSQQVADLIKQIHELREPKLLIAVDQEGGRVQRFKNEFIALPAVRALGNYYKQNPKIALQYAKETGWLMAAELRAVGVDISFAPVLDLDRGMSTVIGDRAFHKNKETLSELAYAYITGMREAGMAATGKHFPGHGAVVADSHVALPVDERTYQDIYAEDMYPFRHMIHNGLPAIMVAHVIYSKVDHKPASLSHIWITEILRQQLGFKGVVFSDDLTMEAAASCGSYAERAEQSLAAGCDMIIVCNNRSGCEEILDHLQFEFDPVSLLRLTRMHGRAAPTWPELHISERWSHACEIIRQYDTLSQLNIDW